MAQGLPPSRPPAASPQAPPPHHIEIARCAHLLVIRVVGHANMVLAPVLEDLSALERLGGIQGFVVDLKQCTGLDSTFMGVLTEMAQDPVGERPGDAPTPLSPEEALRILRREAPAPASGAPPGAWVTPLVGIVNASERCANALRGTGVDQFVRLLGAVDLSGLEMIRVPPRPTTQDERRQLILRVHRKLIELVPSNETAFGPMLRHILDEMNKPGS